MFEQAVHPTTRTVKRAAWVAFEERDGMDVRAKATPIIHLPQWVSSSIRVRGDHISIPDRWKKPFPDRSTTLSTFLSRSFRGVRTSCLRARRPSESSGHPG